MTSANEKLIKNLENQLERLVRQLKELEEFKNELSPSELKTMKFETGEQIVEFNETLDRMQKRDVSLNNKLSTIKSEIQTAIAKSFNTSEIIKMFGSLDVAILENRLIEINQEFRLKKISKDEMIFQRTEVLVKLKLAGYSISVEDIVFLEQQRCSDVQRMEEIVDE